ncbi:MAG: hypothetical protein ACWA5P_03080 [bacterium]
MTLKKISTLLIILAMVQLSFGQKVKIKKNQVTIDKESICRVEKDDVSRGAFYINDLDDENQLYFKWIDWGEFGYFEAYRADDLDEILFETEAGIGYRKWIIKKLYKADVLTAAGIDQEKLDLFSKKIGKEFSRRRSRY